MKQCCASCMEGQVTRSPCVTDVERDCAKPCESDESFINWSLVPPQCETCKQCAAADFLVPVQHCSSSSEAICECQPGYYCQTPVYNTCARCVPHTECPPGYGARRRGTAKEDTECEVCPGGTYSSVTSATGGCTSHTNCSKLDQRTAKKGNATADAMCLGRGLSVSISTDRNNPRESTRVEDPAGRVVAVERNARYTTPGVRTLHVLSQTKSLTSSMPVTPTKAGSDDTGNLNNVYMAVGITCVITLLIVLLLIWKQKICSFKLWLIMRKNFFPLKFSANTLVTHREDGNMETLLQRQNSTRSQNIIPESHQRSEIAHSDWLTDDKPDGQPGRDHLNNRIEKIYIMNADTVLVGSISEVPNRRRSATLESDSKESPVSASHYPQQESSKVPVDELMLSVEEEESETHTAELVLPV
ncbi:tumor necrosis factor receptor superfamily member 8-like [Pseudophryne corroboree]|uniref:tumor necrosis factor receptor superfamily member 8-like n=1 Tax=Pseudophryne corroboree TaxID=495146 RepID=UPI0030820C65